MFYLETMCCLCLKSSASLSDLFSTNRDGLTHFEKVEFSLTRLTDLFQVIEDDEDLLVCDRCSDIIDMIYRFNNICLKNIERFSSYKSILKQNKRKTGCNLSIKLKKDLEVMMLETNSENEECLDSDSDESSSNSGYIALADLDDLDEVLTCDLDLSETRSNRPEQEELLATIDEEHPHGSDRSNSQPNKFLIRSKQVSKDKKYICNECNQTFTLKQNLVKHLRIHSDEKPFTCVVCMKLFNRKGNLDTHMLIHSDEKPHICDVCKKAFRYKSHLTSHKLVHSGEKKFSCKECSKIYVRKCELVRHKRTHTGDKPYTCEMCDKAFM